MFKVDDVARLAPLSSELPLLNWVVFDDKSELVVDNNDEGNNDFFESAIISHLRDSRYWQRSNRSDVRATIVSLFE